MSSPCLLLLLSVALAPPTAGLKLAPAAQAPKGPAWAAATEVDALSNALPYYDIFARLAESRDFATEYFARRPVLLDEVPGIAGSFTLDDVQRAVDSDFLDAGRGVADGKGGWKMAPVSQPRGSSFEDAKMRYVDVAAAIRKGTVVFNSAGAHIPKLGAYCLAALDAFELPNCLNLYLTGAGVSTSAPPHTDKQDVFVLQTCGAKHWRVFAPPPPHKKPLSDPLARGKAHDALSLSELDAPLLDVVLHPGMCLYVPAGFPHTTDTVNTRGEGDGEAAGDSVHLTIGIDTHIWGLNYNEARKGALRRARLPDTLGDTQVPPAKYWGELMEVPGSLGFLRRHAAVGADGADGASAVAARLAGVSRAVEAERWGSHDDEAIMSSLDAEAVATQLERHAERMVGVMRAMYLDAANDVRSAPPGSPPISLFRVKEHMGAVERAMEEHVSGFAPSDGGGGARFGGGGAATAAASKKGKAKAAIGGGFGGGGGKGKGGKKGKAKKKR